MLNGADPILIFQFYKRVETFENLVAAIPIVSGTVQKLDLPPIPVYLSEKLTGLYIDSEDKQIEIETETETLTDGSDPKHNQKAINSVVTINMQATRESLGLTLLMSLADLILPKVTSKEYSVTYMHGAIVVFEGLLHSFSVTQNASDDRYNIKLELARTINKTQAAQSVTVVAPVQGTVPL